MAGETEPVRGGFVCRPRPPQAAITGPTIWHDAVQRLRLRRTITNRSPQGHRLIKMAAGNKEAAALLQRRRT